MAPPHRPADLSLWLGLALLPGASTGPARPDSTMPRCPAPRPEVVSTRGREQLQLVGYKLLEAGRVEDAVAFFQWHVADARGRAAQKDRDRT